MKLEKKTVKIFANKNLLSFMWILFYAAFDAGNFFILLRSYSKSLFGEIVFFFACAAITDNIMNGYIYNTLIRFTGSAGSDKERETVTGAAWFLNILAVVFISAVCVIMLISFHVWIKSSLFFDYLLFGPVILVCSVPLNNLKSQFQSQNKYREMIMLQSICNVPYFVFLVLNYFFLKLPVGFIFSAYTASLGLASLTVLLTGRSGILLLRKCKRKTIKAMHKFGMYSLGSNISSILLRNLPIILIGIMLSKLDEALFNIPFKLITIFSIPLEAAAIVAYNNMLKAAAENNHQKIIDLYYRYTGVLLFLFIPGLLFSFLCARQIIFIFAGNGYSELDTCIFIFRVFLAYIAFLTIDRLGGAILNSLNRPYYDFIKVTIMLFINISGIISVIYIFKAVELVAFVYVLSMAIGTFVGIIFVNKYLKLDVRLVFPAGWLVVKSLLLKVKTVLKFRFN